MLASPLSVGRHPARAFRRGGEGDGSHRLLPWAGIVRSPFTVGATAEISVVIYRGCEGEDVRRLWACARGRGSPSPFTVGWRPKILLVAYRGREAGDSRRHVLGARG